MDIVNLLNTNAPHTASPKSLKRRRPANHDKLVPSRRRSSSRIRPKQEYPFDQWQPPNPYNWPPHPISTPPAVMSGPYQFDPSQYRGNVPIAQNSLPSQHGPTSMESSLTSLNQTDHSAHSMHHMPGGDSIPNDDEQTVKTFSCSTCHKGFARRSDLVRHERIHSGDRPHVCSHEGCGKQFIQRSALTVHQRVHTKEKPHLCEKCGKPFSDSSSLARHRRIHSGTRPYKCPYADCQKTFTRRTTLTRHISHHTGTVEEAEVARAAALATRVGAQIMDDSKMHKMESEDHSDASSSVASHAKSSSTRMGSARALSAQMQRHPQNPDTSLGDNMDPALTSGMPSRTQSAMANRHNLGPSDQDYTAANHQMQQSIPGAPAYQGDPNAHMQQHLMHQPYPYQDGSYPQYSQNPYYHAPDAHMGGSGAGYEGSQHVKNGVWSDQMS